MTRVMIAGGGIGGLVAALCLHEAGHDVDVYESVVEPTELGVGINVLPHSIRVLDRLGLLGALDEIGVRTSALTFLSRDGTEIWSEPRGVEAGNPWPQFSVHRGRFHMLLWRTAVERLGAERLHAGYRFESFEQAVAGPTSVTANFTSRHGLDDRGGRRAGGRRNSDRRILARSEHGDEVGSHGRISVTGDVLIGADGIHSTVRRQMYPHQGDPRPSGLVLWRGAVRAPTFLDGRTMFMAGDDSQKVVVYPIGRPEGHSPDSVLVNWVAERPLDVDMATVSWNRPVDVGEVAAHYRDWDFGWLHVGDLIASTPQAYEFPMVDRDPVDRWSFGRVTLLGDAAHPMRPNGSNGSSQAILDGEALTAALGAHADPIVALAAYESERLDPTARLTLANRQAGPERVMQWVADRCDGSCVGEHRCVDRSDLEREATAYKQLAGFDIAHLRALADDQPRT